jgi:hypothetical protein
MVIPFRYQIIMMIIITILIIDDQGLKKGSPIINYEYWRVHTHLKHSLKLELYRISLSLRHKGSSWSVAVSSADP